MPAAIAEISRIEAPTIAAIPNEPEISAFKPDVNRALRALRTHLDFAEEFQAAAEGGFTEEEADAFMRVYEALARRAYNALRGPR